MTRTVFRTLLIFLLSCSVVSSGEPTRRDGNWWVGQSDMFKLSYVLGLLDGVTLGRDFAVRGLSVDAMKSTLDRFTDNQQLLISNVTVGQVVAGLNDFYQDYKNRKIESVFATEVVLEGTAGMPKEQIEKWVEGMRRMASSY